MEIYTVYSYNIWDITYIHIELYGSGEKMETERKRGMEEKYIKNLI